MKPDYSSDPNAGTKVTGGPIPRVLEEGSGDYEDGAELLKGAKTKGTETEQEPETTEPETTEPDIDTLVDMHIQEKKRTPLTPNYKVEMPKLNQEIPYEAPVVDEVVEPSITDDELEDIGLSREAVEKLIKIIEAKTAKTVKKEVVKIENAELQLDWNEQRTKANRELYKKYPELMKIETRELDPKDSRIAQELHKAYQMVDMQDANAPVNAIKIAEMALGIVSAQEEGAQQEMERHTRTQAHGALSKGGRPDPALGSTKKSPDLDNDQKYVARKLNLTNQEYAKFIGNSRTVTGPEFYNKWKQKNQDPKYNKTGN